MDRCTFHSVVTTVDMADTRHGASRGSLRDAGEGRGLTPPPELPDQAPAGDAVLVRNRSRYIHLEPPVVGGVHYQYTLINFGGGQT